MIQTGTTASTHNVVRIYVNGRLEGTFRGEVRVEVVPPWTDIRDEFVNAAGRLMQRLQPTVDAFRKAAREIFGTQTQGAIERFVRAAKTGAVRALHPVHLRARALEDRVPIRYPGLANPVLRFRACARQAVPPRTRRRLRVWER